MNIKNKRKQTINGPGGLRLQLDADQIFPDDPGQGTPCLLEQAIRGRVAAETGTMNCALGEGYVGDYRLTDEQMEWINELEYPVDTWLTNWTK